MRRAKAVAILGIALLCVVGAGVFRGRIRDWRYRNYCEVRIVNGSNWFDYPVGAPNAKGYYRAGKFGEDRHLGEDWNGKGGGNSDYGDLVYAIADGTVSYAEDTQLGWGNVVRIVHPVDKTHSVEAVYAHLAKMRVHDGAKVKRGQEIGTIGNADGAYQAHLHFEIRSQPGLPLGGGYSANPAPAFLDPSEFIDNHRKH
jgi:murein DD-endopeptidase MepM/ murein hydrolase activator NlpD